MHTKTKTLCIALLACGWPPNKNYKWSDARYLIALGKQYSRQKYFNNEYTFYVPVSKGKNSFCELIPDCSIEFLVCEDDSVTIRADIPEVLSAPVNSSQIYGAINIYVNNEPIRSISLKAKQCIPKKVHVLDIINKIFQ